MTTTHRKISVHFIPLLIPLALCSAGCNEATLGSATSNVAATTLQPPSPTNGVTVIAATAAQCPTGGVVIQAYQDNDRNGSYTAGEPILSTTPVCNGASGQSGLGSGIQVTQATDSQCAAGGLNIKTFSDFNNNGVLDGGESVNSINTLCNGTNGRNGADGNTFSVSQTAATANQCPAGGYVYTVNELDSSGAIKAGSTTSNAVCNGSAGANGEGLVFTTIPATQAQCPAGGSVLVTASDTARTGVYDATDAHQDSVVICNGADGAQGAAGPVSPFSPVSPITPCGANSSPWKEVLLCLADGNILADFSADASGAQTRLSFIPEGSYADTDSSGCGFSVSADGRGGSNVSWGAGSNAYATWAAGSYDCIKLAPSSGPRDL